MLPEKIEISPEFAKRLAALADKQAAVQNAVRLAQENWERRGAELQAEGRQIWDDIAKAYGVKPDQVNYVLSSDGKTLTPVSMRLA